MTTNDFDRDRFLGELATFVGFKTVVCQNRDEFERADRWIHGMFDPERTEIEIFDCHGLSTSIIRPKGSRRPAMLGDGHIEVVPGPAELFELTERDGLLYGRGVADMKTQCLMMIWALRRAIDRGDPPDFWLLLSEDEEVGSRYGVEVVTRDLARRGLLPDLVFAPDGGPGFSYVEKEKGIVTFTAEVPGRPAHASRPWLGENPIDRAQALYADLRRAFPNPEAETDWRPSLSMTVIEAGSASNQIPDACRAGFDLRITENENRDDVVAQIEAIAARHGAELEIGHADPATHYPRNAPVARRFLDILRRATGEEPEILHSAGASNGRLYVERDPRTHVLMTSPRMGDAHSDTEWLDPASLDAFWRVVTETVELARG